MVKSLLFSYKYTAHIFQLHRNLQKSLLFRYLLLNFLYTMPLLFIRFEFIWSQHITCYFISLGLVVNFSIYPWCYLFMNTRLLFMFFNLYFLHFFIGIENRYEWKEKQWTHTKTMEINEKRVKKIQSISNIMKCAGVTREIKS